VPLYKMEQILGDLSSLKALTGMMCMEKNQFHTKMRLHDRINHIRNDKMFVRNTLCNLHPLHPCQRYRAVPNDLEWLWTRYQGHATWSPLFRSWRTSIFSSFSIL